jgi:hypothetical protein
MMVSVLNENDIKREIKEGGKRYLLGKNAN